MQPISHGTLITLASSKRIGRTSKKQEIRHFKNLAFGYPILTNLGSLNWFEREKRKLTCRLYLKQSKSEYFQEWTGLKHNPNLLRFSFQKFHHGFSKRPSLKLIDQKMYKNQQVISWVEHSITFLTIVWKLRSKPGYRVFQSPVQREFWEQWTRHSQSYERF